MDTNEERRDEDEIVNPHKEPRPASGELREALVPIMPEIDRLIQCKDPKCLSCPNLKKAIENLRAAFASSERGQESQLNREVAAIAYQCLGALSEFFPVAPVRLLDYFSAIANGEKAINPLPFSPDECMTTTPAQGAECLICKGKGIHQPIRVLGNHGWHIVDCPSAHVTAAKDAEIERLKRQLLDLAKEGMVLCTHSISTPGCWRCDLKRAVLEPEASHDIYLNR